MEKIGEMHSDYGKCAVMLGFYQAAPQPAITLEALGDASKDVYPGEKISTLSVCMPSDKLGQNEFFAKTYSENEPLRPFALASGLFEDTGRRVRSGYVDIEVWRILVGR